MTRQTFDTIDVLRLEVGQAPTVGLRNLLPNPNGERGAWGWITPTAGVDVNGATLAGGGSEDMDDTWGGHFTFSAPAGGSIDCFMYSEPQPVTAGQYAAGAITIKGGNTPLQTQGKISLVFWNKAGAIISTSAETSIPANSANFSVWRTPVVQAPAGTVNVSLQVKVNTPAGVARVFRFGSGMLASAGTSAALANLAYNDRWVYTDILQPSMSITSQREGLALGTLQAVIRSATLDPAVNSLIKPGNPVRLMARVADAGGVLTSAYQPLFVGEVKNGTTRYDLTATDPDKRAVISLTAVDGAARLANAPQPYIAKTIGDVAYLVEGAGVPFEVNGSTSLIPGAAAAVASNANGKVLGQVAIARDTALGHAWVSRHNVLKARDSGTMPATVRATLDEDAYTENIDIDYDTGRCINVVTVKSLTYAAGAGTETAEIVYGPFAHDASVAANGVYAEEFTVAGVNTAQAETLANAVLTANATPAVRCNGLTIPIVSTLDLRTAERRALLDLYDRVTVNNTRAALSETLRIAGVRHIITPKKWLTDLVFASTAGVALPSPAAPLPGQARPQVVNPPGEVVMYAGATLPAGWLWCRGASVAVADYPELHAAIGYTYGGSGANFNLPNLNGRSPIGTGVADSGSVGNNYTLGQKWGHEAPQSHTHTGSTGTESAFHTHQVDNAEAPAYAWTITGSGGAGYRLGGTKASGVQDQLHTHNFTTAPSGAGDKGNVHPVLGLNFIIRAY